MKRLLRLVTLAGIAAGAVWWFRERLIPPPATPLEHPPHFRSAPHPPEEPEPVRSDDLADVKGIGPVYRERLADQGITSFAQLARAESAPLAEAIDVAVTQLEDWQEQARHLA